MNKISRLQYAAKKIQDATPCWEHTYAEMNAYFVAAGVGLRWEDGDLVNRPELANPAVNRNIKDYE